MMFMKWYTFDVFITTLVWWHETSWKACLIRHIVFAEKCYKPEMRDHEGYDHERYQSFLLSHWHISVKIYD